MYPVVDNCRSSVIIIAVIGAVRCLVYTRLVLPAIHMARCYSARSTLPGERCVDSLRSSLLTQIRQRAARLLNHAGRHARRVVLVLVLLPLLTAGHEAPSRARAPRHEACAIALRACHGAPAITLGRPPRHRNACAHSTHSVARNLVGQGRRALSQGLGPRKVGRVADVGAAAERVGQRLELIVEHLARNLVAVADERDVVFLSRVSGILSQATHLEPRVDLDEQVDYCRRHLLPLADEAVAWRHLAQDRRVCCQVGRRR